jgi:glycosyltransferase involved in cell wall biosynthesis
VLEAGACGTPAVATDVPGLRDAVRDGETGFLVRTPDATAFADALRRILDDPALRARLGEAAHRFAATFDWDAVAGEISAVLDAARGMPARVPAGAAAESA